MKVILEQEQAPIIVQLGAHIGNMDGDPLYPVLSRESEGITKKREFSSIVILVEPVRKHFEKLKEAYAGIPEVIFKNVTVADYDGIADFYSLGVNPEDYSYPRWFTELGSLKKSRTNELWDNYEGEKNTKKFLAEHQIQETVECMKLESLMTMYHLNRLDLVQIDVEGYEYEILTDIDFSKYSIRFINYERVLLQGNQEACENYLRNYGYRLLDHDKDTLAYQISDQKILNKMFC